MSTQKAVYERRAVKLTPAIDRRAPNPVAQRRRDNLQGWMEREKMSRTELAAKLHVGRAYVSLLFRPDRFFGEKAARAIEESLNMPKDYLESSGQPGEGTQAWSRPSDLIEDMWGLVPRIDLVVAEDGVRYEERQLPAIALTKASMVAKGVTASDGLVCWTATDAAMSPFIQAGDLVLLDTKQTAVLDGEVYALRNAAHVRIRRLNRTFDGGLLMRSDNPLFPDETLPAEHVTPALVLGRVIHRAG